VYDWKDDRIVTNLSHLGLNITNKVALTFDDGPNENSGAILNILKRQNIQATFFWLSSQLDDKSLISDFLEAGHTIGLHGFRHLPFHRLSPAIQEREIKKGLNQLLDFTDIKDRKIKYFRPPYGRYNDATLKILKEQNLVPLLWDVASLDWELEDNPTIIIENVTNHIKGGSIILLHDLPQTVEILEDLIIKLKSLGYKFCTLK
jgi:peptidoglycan/xylan/chitin deacetylase (PgdA/CDA1 family)